MRSRIFLVLLTLALIAAFAAPNVFAQTTITYTRWAGTQEATDFQKLVDTFVASHPDIQVKTEFLPWSAYWEKVRTTVLAGNAADVISLSNVEQGAYITRGVFKVLDDLPGAKALYAQMAPGAQAADIVTGKIRAIPVGAGVRAMIYNKDLLDTAGVAYPDPVKPMTWDQFVQIAKKLTVKDGDKFVQYTARFHVMEMYESFIVGAGGKLMDSYTHPTKILVNSKEGIAGLTVLQNLFKQNVLPPYTGEWQTEFGTPDDAVATGKVVFEQTGPWGFPPLLDKGINVGTAPLPMGKVRSTRGYFNSLAISRNSKNTAAAWEFIKWMTSAEGQLEFTKTGDLPANSKAFIQAQNENPYPYSKDMMKPFFSEIPFVITGPMLPTTEFTGVLESALTDLFQLRSTPQQTAAKIEKDGKDIISSLFE